MVNHRHSEKRKNFHLVWSVGVLAMVEFLYKKKKKNTHWIFYVQLYFLSSHFVISKATQWLLIVNEYQFPQMMIKTDKIQHCFAIDSHLYDSIWVIHWIASSKSNQVSSSFHLSLAMELPRKSVSDKLCVETKKYQCDSKYDECEADWPINLMELWNFWFQKGRLKFHRDHW